MKKTLIVVLGLCIAMFTASSVTAQVIDPTTLHEVCTGTTTCVPSPPNSTTQVVTSLGNPTFNITTQKNSGLNDGQTGELYLLVMVPNTTLPSFTVNGISAAFSANFSGGKLEDSTVMNLTLNATSNPAFSAFQSASAQVGVTANSFTIYTVNLGAITAPTGGFTTGAVLAAINTFSVNLPKGTVLYSMLTDSANVNGTPNGSTIVNTTPLSEIITVGNPVPEPTSMLLFGSGLLVAGAKLRKRIAGARS